MGAPAGLPADGCGAPVGGHRLEESHRGTETVVQGVVTRAAGEPVGNAYVRLLDGRGEFTAEVPTGNDGRFRFFAAPGTWTLRTLAPATEPVDLVVEARRADVTEVVVELGG
ncbi:MAG TPA: DUF1416 domain-containing protein [Nocardioidaceae bacterium]